MSAVLALCSCQVVVSFKFEILSSRLEAEENENVNDKDRRGG